MLSGISVRLRFVPGGIVCVLCRRRLVPVVGFPPVWFAPLHAQVLVSASVSGPVCLVRPFPFGLFPAVCSQ